MLITRHLHPRTRAAIRRRAFLTTGASAALLMSAGRPPQLPQPLGLADLLKNPCEQYKLPEHRDGEEGER